MKTREEMYRILDFILNQSTEEEIEVIRQAMIKRTEDLRFGASRLRIQEMARKTGESVQEQFTYSDRFQSMMRGFIRRTIREDQPEMPEKELEEILDRCLPNQKTAEKGKEDDLPAEVVRSMIVQFVDYSLGRMPEEQKGELVSNWHKQYWGVFGSRTRKLIADLLDGKIEEKTFWEEIGRPDEAL